MVITTGDTKHFRSSCRPFPGVTVLAVSLALVEVCFGNGSAMNFFLLYRLDVSFQLDIYCQVFYCVIVSE